MPDNKPKNSTSDRPEKFDPKKTPLSAVEVFALVLPIVGTFASLALFFVVYDWIFPDSTEFPEDVKWINFVLMLVFAFGGGKIASDVSDKILERINSPHLRDAGRPPLIVEGFSRDNRYIS